MSRDEIGEPRRGAVSIGDLELRIATGFAAALPGPAAQLILAPRPRHGWTAGVVPEGCRRGAVLLLVYPIREEACVLLTVRDVRLPTHPGQVSLPGGAIEDGETVERAALRESEEEVGVLPSVVRVVGTLTPLHVPVSRFVLHPVVGVADQRPALRPRSREVRRILEPRIVDLNGPIAIEVEQRERGGPIHEVPYLRVSGEKVWGATAMILAEFLALVGLPPRSAAQGTP